MSTLIPALSLAGFVVVAVMRVTDPLLPVIAQDFQVSVGQAGMVITSFAIGYGLFLLLYGPLGDRHGKLRVIALTLAGAALCVGACAFAPDLRTLAALRFLTGMTTAAAVPLSLAYIGDNVPLEIRQPTLARYMSGVIFGQMLGAGLGGVLSDAIGWRAIFIVFAVAVAGAAAVIAGLARKESVVLVSAPISLLKSLGQYVSLTRDPKAADLLIAAFVEGLCVFGGVAYIGAMLHARHHLSFTLIGLFLIAYGGGGLIYSLSAARLLRQFGRRGMMVLGGACMATAFIGLALLPVGWGAPPLILLLGLGFYILHSTLQTLATELLPKARGTSFAIFAFALFAGQAVGVTCLGLLVDAQGYPVALATVGVCLGALGLWLRNSPAITRYGRG